MTSFEFQKRFPTELSAINFIVSIKYTNGYHCPKCGCIHKNIRYVKHRQNHNLENIALLMGNGEMDDFPPNNLSIYEKYLLNRLHV